jgi:hypothetical protein
MNEATWKSFLSEYNRELLSYEEVVERLPRELLKTEWLGFPGATDEEIAATESRLNTHLPPSYCAFLKVSNGWRFPSVFIFNMLPVSRLAWFQEENQDWIDAYTDQSTESPPISDEEYFVYGDRQDCIKFRPEYLRTALQISELGDSAVVLLNPEIRTPEGEWETWFFANWLPGAVRYRSFGEWLAAERHQSQKQLKPLPKSRVKTYLTSKRPLSVKKAAEAARRGQTQIAIESLESFVAKDDDSAAASLAELYAFLGQWDKVILNAGRAITNPAVFQIDNVFTDMMNLLGRAGHRSKQWKGVIEAAEAAVKSNECRNAGKDLEHSRNRYDKIFLNLIEYAKRQGKPPHELIAIFATPDHLKYLKEPKNLSHEQRVASFQNAIKIANAIPYLKTPHARAEHVFSLIKDEWEDAALKLYEAHGAKFLMAWDAAVYVARACVRRGNPEAAWEAILSNLAKWWPVAVVQVAPIILLTDEHLSTLMTPERGHLVLSTRRGPEALQKKK